MRQYSFFQIYTLHCILFDSSLEKKPWLMSERFFKSEHIVHHIPAELVWYWKWFYMVIRSPNIELHIIAKAPWWRYSNNTPETLGLGSDNTKCVILYFTLLLLSESPIMYQQKKEEWKKKKWLDRGKVR